MQDSVNAFIETFEITGAADGPLSGLTFGAKDLYDIAGHMTGCGSPDWAITHGLAEKTAPAVQALLDVGATLVGKTHTDEIAYSLMGVNAHYGTPINSAAPDRIPGGSSSGSVAATAAGMVDIGLGSDTGGSIRMPASFCGVYGIRTTHGEINISHTMPLAPSFDTCGWFARDANTFALTGKAYGLEVEAAQAPKRLLIADDAFALADIDTQDVLLGTLDSFKEHFTTVDKTSLYDGDSMHFRKTFMVCQAAEVWETHGEWVRGSNPDFGPGVKGRFDMAASITQEQLIPARAARAKIKSRLFGLLRDDTIIALPTGPGPAPLRSADDSALNDFRMAALDLLCGAGLAGLPQINIPAGMVDGCPVGLGLIGSKGSDADLLRIAVALSH